MKAKQKKKNYTGCEVQSHWNSQQVRPISIRTEKVILSLEGC